jgi:hypothetical protein
MPEQVRHDGWGEAAIALPATGNPLPLALPIGGNPAVSAGPARIGTAIA